MTRSEFNRGQRTIKRTFDLIVSSFCLLVLWWLIAFAWAIASVETRSNGLFFQERVGLNGRIFRIIKIKTMYDSSTGQTTVTTSKDFRITNLGRFLRLTKVDELPQLWNVFRGEMSMVGPRPDVAGFADHLEGEDRLLLSVRPGITGPASIKYRNEEDLLAKKSNPEEFYRNVIWPDKVKLNLTYIKEWTLLKDVRYIMGTVFRC